LPNNSMKREDIYASQERYMDSIVANFDVGFASSADCDYDFHS